MEPSMRPLSRVDIVKFFGDPLPHMAENGMPTQSWELSILGVAELPAPLPLSWDRTKSVHRFRCHHLLVGHFEAAFNRVHQSPEAWATVNDFGGCYMFRSQRNAYGVLSTYAWGIAVDIDVLDNPMGGTPRVHPRVIESFESEGFLWGGRFQGKRRDAMHMEFADPSKLVKGTVTCPA
jgi:hypothetical protein